MKRVIQCALTGVLCVAMLAGIFPAVRSVADETDTEWEELSGVLETIYGEWKDTTYAGLFSNQIPDTALLGNGDVGVTSGGDARSKTFYLSKSDFWQYGGSPLPIGGVTIEPAATEADKAVSLAQGATVLSCCAHESFPASRVTSGAWTANSGYEGWVSTVDLEETHWLIVDLGETKTFDYFIVRHDAAARPAETANVTKGFILSVADNARGPFTTVYETSDNSDPTSKVKLDKAVTARYIQLEITVPTQGTTPDSRDNPRARIGQLEVYDTATQQVDGDYVTPVTGGFYEKENLRDAQIETQMDFGQQAVVMTTFTTRDNLVVTAMTGKGTAPVALRATAWAKADDASRPVTAATDGETALVTRATANPARNNEASYTSQAALALRVVGASSTAATGEKGSAYVTFTLKPGETVYLVTAVGGGGQTFDNTGKLKAATAPVEEAKTLLNTAADVSAIAAKKEAHAAWWKAFWLDSYILLDESDADLKTIQRYYYAAQYLLGCMCNTDGVAPGLYGIWHTTDTPSWNSDYHLNYNFISTFYGLFSSGRAALAKSAVQQILDYLPAARAASQSVTELRKVNADFVNYKIEKGDIDATKGIEGGIVYPVGIGPYGMILDANYHNQTLNASFSATLLIAYYEYTRDTAFLQDELYEYLKACATFYEAWLEHDDETGVYTLYAGYNEGSWAINSAAELAMLKNVLTRLIGYAATLGRDGDRVAKWTDMLENLADQPTANFGGKVVYALAEQEYSGGSWNPMTNPVPGDGNIIPMESVVPGDVLGYYSSSEQLAVAKNTIDVFATRGAWGQNNNFPKIFSIAVNTRYDAAAVAKNLASVIRQKTVANLRISDNTHGAEKSGATLAVNNMLVLSDSGIIKLFGGWQANKSAAFKRLATAGGYLVSAQYDGTAKTVAAASLESPYGGTVTMAALWDEMKVLDANGNEVAATRGTAPNHPDEATYTFETQAGGTYTFVPVNAVKPGDADDDGEITTTDARLTLQFAADKIAADQLDLAAADVDKDTKVSTTDARMILQYAAQKITSFE